MERNFSIIETGEELLSTKNSETLKNQDDRFPVVPVVAIVGIVIFGIFAMVLTAERNPITPQIGPNKT
jgi:hypothetical protein